MRRRRATPGNAARPRRVTRESAARPAGSLFCLVMLKRMDNDDYRWAHQDDKQGREDAADHREKHFQGRLRGLLLRSLTAAAPHLFRLDPEHFRDTDAELFRLDQRLDEGVQLLDAGAGAHVVAGLQA